MKIHFSKRQALAFGLSTAFVCASACSDAEPTASSHAECTPGGGGRAGKSAADCGSAGATPSDAGAAGKLDGGAPNSANNAGGANAGGANGGADASADGGATAAGTGGAGAEGGGSESQAGSGGDSAQSIPVLVISAGATSDRTSLYALDLGDTEPTLRLLTHAIPPNSNVVSFSVSPDGSRVAFVVAAVVTALDLYVVDIDGAHTRKLSPDGLADGMAYILGWSRSGASLSFQHDGQDRKSTRLNSSH